MTYAQDEASRESGSPIELYEFVGTIETFRITNNNQDYEFGGDTYFAVPLTRSELVVNAGSNAPELSITVPITLDLISKYVFQVAPQELDLTVTRVHVESGDFDTYWSGPVTAFSVKERLVTMRCPSKLGVLMEYKLPTIRYQPYCNNVLYDTVCNIPASSYLKVGTLSTINNTGKILTVSAAGLPDVADQWARGGEIVNTDNGERRMIIDHVGNTLTILWPFSINTAVAANIGVYAGCDHSIATCSAKFINWDNFNGMPFVLTQTLSTEQES